MTIIWGIRRNLENSLTEFLQQQIAGQTVFYKGKNLGIDIRVGHAPRNDWKIPNIAIYLDTRTAPRGFIGNNKRLNSYLMIIDIRAFDDGMRSDLTELVTDIINNGFDVYTYSPNAIDPSTPIKSLSGKASIEFISDNPIRSTENADQFEKYRQNISINVTIAV